MFSSWRWRKKKKTVSNELGEGWGVDCRKRAPPWHQQEDVLGKGICNFWNRSSTYSLQGVFFSNDSQDERKYHLAPPVERNGGEGRTETWERRRWRSEVQNITSCEKKQSSKYLQNKASIEQVPLRTDFINGRGRRGWDCCRFKL